jgi:Family of unknown function (DUF6518)
MTPSIRRSMVIVGVAALAFGVSVSIVKGNGGGVRDAIGNTSAPWLLLPFVAVLYSRITSIRRGVVTGVLASMTALCGFYVANAFVLDLGPHSWLDDISLTVKAGRLFFALAVVSGPSFGALGARWNRTRSRWLAVLIAGLLVVEPLASWLYGLMGRVAYANVAVVWAGEITVGLCACAATAVRLGQDSRNSRR